MKWGQGSVVRPFSTYSLRKRGSESIWHPLSNDFNFHLSVQEQTKQAQVQQTSRPPKNKQIAHGKRSHTRNSTTMSSDEALQPVLRSSTRLLPDVCIARTAAEQVGIQNRFVCHKTLRHRKLHSTSLHTVRQTSSGLDRNSSSYRGTRPNPQLLASDSDYDQAKEATRQELMLHFIRNHDYVLPMDSI